MSFTQHSVIPLHVQYNYIYTWRIPTCFPAPCCFSFAPLCVPFVPPSTYLAPSGCDRNRPPPSQVACKLTPFAPPFTQLTHPSQIPRTPPAPRLITTTSGIFRLLLSGTLSLSQVKKEQKTNKYLLMNSNCPFILPLFNITTEILLLVQKCINPCPTAEDKCIRQRGRMLPGTRGKWGQPRWGE